MNMDRLSEYVQEDRDKHCVGEIDEKDADHRDDQKCPRRPAVAVDENLHVGHGIGRRAEHKTAETSPHDGGIVIFAHEPENRPETG